MKKEVVGRGILILSILTILMSGVFAAAPASGTCGISLRSECVGATNHILMGVSSLTNAHGEIPDSGLYNYVLCCAFGTGLKTCGLTNKIIGLSSATNAHAQEPTLTNYLTNVCYEDLVCDGISGACTTEYPLGILSLSSDTNAHIGAFADYPVKICCSSAAYSLCQLQSAEWNILNAVEGQEVRLRVTGTPSCAGLKVSFKVWEDDTSDDTPAQIIPQNVSFNGSAITYGTWAAEWIDDGIFGGNPEYYFNVTLERNPPSRISSSLDNELTVTQYEEDDCAPILTCEDYTDEEWCTTDFCNRAADNSIPDLVDCTNTEGGIQCMCSWNSDVSSCGFTWTEITECGSPVEGEGCMYGCTLCHNSTENYCKIGATCPPGEAPLGNNNGSCDFGEGCLSSLDCFNGDTDTCAEGLFCSSGMCYTFENDFINPPINLGLCKTTQDVEKQCDEEPVGSKIILWTGEWLGEGECGSTCQSCNALNGKRTTISCAAQVQLPFFDYYELIIAVIVIAVIYISMIFRKKFHRKKKRD